MKILKVVMHEVVVPTHEGRVDSVEHGPCEWDKASKFIIELYTDEGIVGLSETARGASENAVRGELEHLFGRFSVEAICWQEPGASDHNAHDRLAKESPEELTRLYERTSNHFTRAFLQVGWLDLMGKKTGLPASSLLGGAYRKQVRVDYWMGQMTPDDSATACFQAKAWGYSGVKCKCVAGDDNVARAAAVRDACGADFKMTFDPNYRFYRYGETIGMLRDLAAVGNIGCVEDPFLPADLEGYRMLRAQGLFPVALHNSLSDGARVIEAIRAEAVDYMNLSLWPTDTQKAGDICYAANIPTWHGSGVDLGVLEAAYLHTAAATKSMSRPSDFAGRLIRQHNLITNLLLPLNGFMSVPQGAGLGVELDRDALDRFTVRQVSFVIPA